MGEKFARLLEKIARGECVQGTYIRRASAVNGSIRFAELVVRSSGGDEYTTCDPHENERFFDLVDYRGYGVNSYSRPGESNHYESMGYWYKV